MGLEHGIQILENCRKRGIAEGAYPGISYAIATKDWVYTNHLGDKSWFPKRLPLRKTIYDAASLTKVVATTTAVMLLLERGELRLVDPVSHYLDRFRHPDVRIFIY